MSFQPIQRASAVDVVLEQLQGQLAAGVWTVGDRIPSEYELAGRLGVSRPAVREAIRALSHVGVLEVRRGDGTFVRTTVDPRPLLRRVELATLRDVFEVQLAYDVQAAKLAARRRTDEDLARLRTLLRDRDTAEDPVAFGEADAAFHLCIAEISKNPLLAEAFRFFQHRLRESLSALRQVREVPEGGPAAHRAVFDAIAARAPEVAGWAAASIIEPALAALDAAL